MNFLKWVKKGRCSYVDKFKSPFERIVPQAYFYPCLDEYMTEPSSKTAYAIGVWEEASASLTASELQEKIRTGIIVGYSGEITVKKIHNASQ